MVSSSALLSADGVYRWTLTRTWAHTKPSVVFIMLNPSTADERLDDPTIRRCIGFAQALNCGELNVVNLFSMRTPSPVILRHFKGDRIGALTNMMIRQAVDSCEKVIVAWGAHGAYYPDRVAEVLELLSSLSLWCYGTTKTGQPKHPLFLRKDAKLEVYQ